MNGKQHSKILNGKGKEWSRESSAIMNTFSQWLTISGLEKMECLNRMDGNTFVICYHHEDEKAEIVLEDESGAIGEPFVWWNESGIAFEDYMTDAGFLFLHIASMCRNQLTIKKIKDFVIENVLK